MMTWWLLALMACGGAPPEAEAPRAQPAPRSPDALPPETAAQHAVVVVIDTLRASAVEEAQTPVLDALAAEGDKADFAWASGTWTVPSVISMLTGRPIREHGWDLPSARLGKYPAVPEMPRISEVLQTSGFRTIGLYSNLYLSEDLGFDRGFDRWSRVSDRSIVKQFQKEVDKHWGEGRHFAYLHLLGPHSPLSPSPEARERHGVDPSWFDERDRLDIGRAKRDREEGVREAYNAAYLAVVEDTDAIVGQLVEALGDHAAETCIIVTSDHGELLGEHGVYGHGSHLWEPLTQVPFLARNCGTLPARISNAAVPHVVTSALHLPATWHTSYEEPVLVSQREGMLALTADGVTKAIWRAEDSEQFDLTADPEELQPVEVSGKLQNLRTTWEDAHPAAPLGELIVELDEATQQGLEELGYVEQEGDGSH